MKELQIKEICQEIIDEQTKCNYSVEYILKNKDDIVRAVAVNKHTKSTIQLDIVDSRNHTQNLDHFNFNPDLFLFSDLERGYELVYAPLNVHYDIWRYVKENYETLIHKKGMNLYFDFCKRKDITENTMFLLSLNKIDISKFYHEKNGSYEIIKEIHINDDSIVIGYSPTSPSKFVTWETNGNRKYGFYTGHYFNEYEEAYKNMEKRAKDLLVQNLCRNKNFLRKNKTNQER